MPRLRPCRPVPSRGCSGYSGPSRLPVDLHLHDIPNFCSRGGSVSRRRASAGEVAVKRGAWWWAQAARCSVAAADRWNSSDVLGARARAPKRKVQAATALQKVAMTSLK